MLFDLSDVALRLLKSYPDLPKESLSGEFPVPDLLRNSLSGNFSVLDALAKMPAAFPSGSRFGRRERFIYDGKFSHFSCILDRYDKKRIFFRK